MGMVIRVLFNNEHWKTPCKNPNKDARCWNCYDKNGKPCNVQKVDILPHHVDGSGNCKANTGDIVPCWEANLCKGNKWGCTPKGDSFDPTKAYKGVKVFFVFKQSDPRYSYRPSSPAKYTLWGWTTIKDRDTQPGSDGYSYLYFNPFPPLPRAKWVSNLTAGQLVGAPFRRGRFRYVFGKQEAYLKKLVN